MSYILDALRRADAERERGSVPGLHTQTFPIDSHAASAIHRAPPWWGIALGLAVALLGIVVWRLFAGEAPHESASPAVPPPPAIQAPLATLPPPLPAPPVVAAAPEPATVVTEPPPVKGNLAPAVTKPVANKPKPVRPSAPTPEDGSQGRVYSRNELPENIRRELPTLAIGGAIHAATPANRMLIINGQLFHEGDKLGTDLTLEQIKLRAAVIKYKDYRYTVSF